VVAGLAGLAAAAGGLLTGCATVPTTGEVEEVQPSGRATEPPQIEVNVDPPAPGASPRLIVSGFVLAMAKYQPNYERARDFLTADVRDDWRPESGVEIIDDNWSLTTTNGVPSVGATLVGRLGPEGSYRAAGGAVTIDLGLVKNDDGEWRISKPPTGLLIAQTDFERVYTPVNLYFFEPSLTSLVPDPIYVANLTASAMMQRLLGGPSDWLRPVVTTAFPDKTSTVGVPLDSAGVADIALNEVASGLNDQRRGLLAAQTVWTLRQVGKVTAVRFTLNGAPYQIGRFGVDPIPVTALDSNGPISPQTSTGLFAVTAAGLQRLDDSAAERGLTPVQGPLGQLAGITSAAVTVAADQAAVVVRNGQEVRVGPFGDREPTSVLTGVDSLERPQYTRFGELLVLQRTASVPVLWYVQDARAERVSVDLPEDMTLSMVRLAPDGIRAAVVVRSGGGSVQYGLMQFTRNGGPRLAAFRAVTLRIGQTQGMAVIDDLVWTDATDLVLLGSATSDGPARPYAITQEGTKITSLGTPDNWQAIALAASQARAVDSEPISEKIAMLGGQGTAWRYDGNSIWSPMANEIKALAYPG